MADPTRTAGPERRSAAFVVTLRRGLRRWAAWIGLAGWAATASAQGGDPASGRLELEARVEAVRAALQAARPASGDAAGPEAPAAAGSDPADPQAQWFNWPNWNNWSNWQNWGNWGNWFNR
jgi:hypothetical protein